MVADRETGRIVGVHVLAQGAGDIIGMAEIILKNRGLPTFVWLRTQA
jgi:pyruvate/2-oxoglutarate dehydrogenase complex dihydrolipoamide dehydrogenase (E3) component